MPDAVARLAAYRRTLPLRVALTHAAVDAAGLDEVFVELETAAGTRGRMEARGNGAYATGRDAEQVLAALTAAAPAVLGAPLEEARARAREAAGDPLVELLVDGAALDARARQRDVPLWSLLGGARRGPIVTHVGLGFEPPDAIGSRAGVHARAGVRRFKVRAGSGDLDQDVDRVAAVRRAAPGAAIAVDANGAWTEEAALEAVERLTPLGVAWIEQPVAHDALDALRRVSRAAVCPVVADEGVRALADVERIAAERSAGGVHLKLEKAGSVAALRRAAAAARSAGLFVELGQMDQGRLGCAMTVAVAAATAADAYELAGFVNLEQDVASGLELADGCVTPPAGAGLGVDVRLPPDALVLEVSR